MAVLVAPNLQTYTTAFPNPLVIAILPTRAAVINAAVLQQPSVFSLINNTTGHAA
jgi:hypothetical protein